MYQLIQDVNRGKERELWALSILSQFLYKLKTALKNKIYWGTWLAQPVDYVTLDFQVVSLSPMLCVEIKNKIFIKKRKKGTIP